MFKKPIWVHFLHVINMCGLLQVRDYAIIIWRGGSKISKVGLKIKLHPPELKLK